MRRGTIGTGDQWDAIGGLLGRGTNGTRLGDYWDGGPLGRDWGTIGTGDQWDMIGGLSGRIAIGDLLGRGNHGTYFRRGTDGTGEQWDVIGGPMRRGTIGTGD